MDNTTITIGEPLDEDAPTLFLDARELVRITSIGADGTLRGDFWSEKDQQYKPFKPINAANGAFRVEIDYDGESRVTDFAPFDDDEDQ